MSNVKIFVIDLDGTLCDDSRRIHLAPKDVQGSWDEYHENLRSDEPIPEFREILADILKNNFNSLLIFSTARPEKYKIDTEDWLRDNFFRPMNLQGRPYKILMRPILDRRPSSILKPEKLLDYLNEVRFGNWKFSDLHVYDNNESVCAAYDSIGANTYYIDNPHPKEIGDEEILDPSAYETAKDIFENVEKKFEERNNARKPWYQMKSDWDLGENRPDDWLRDGANLFVNRNGAYGNNYITFGAVMKAIFPEGLNLETPADFARYGVFTQLVSKITRYAETLEAGGHADSAIDACVYAAMLRELTVHGADKKASD